MPSQSTKETKTRFNELFNDPNIELIKGNRNLIFCMKKYTDNGENLNKKPIDLSIKNKQIAFCSNLPIGALSFSSHVDIKSMNITSSDADMNE